MAIRILRLVARYLAGTVFIFSGFVKAVDPLGSTYKFLDYFEAYGWDFFMPVAFPLAIILSSSELLIGLCLILKLRMKVTAWALFLFMSFFTIVTFYSAIANPVTDCGCFGDAIVLTNWQTFYKNIILFIPVIIVFWQKNNYENEFNIVFEWGLVLVLFLFGIFLSTYSFKNLPLIDFRPYHIGANIPESMRTPEGMPHDEYEIKLIYAKGGENKEFTLENAPYADTNWKWVETKNILIKKGFEPPIHDFSLISAEGDDITQQLLDDQGYSFLIVSNKLEDADREALVKINNFAVKALTSGYQVYGMTASTSEVINSVKPWLKPVFNFYATDDITLKTMVRSNPGLLLIKEGTIIGKWHYRNIPDEKILHSNSLSYTLTEMINKNNNRIAFDFILVIGFFGLVLFFFRKKTGPYEQDE